MDTEPILYVQAIISGLTGIALGVLSVVGLFKARRRHDPSRIWADALKVALPFAALGLILQTASSAMTAAQGPRWYSSGDSPEEVDEMTRRGYIEADTAAVGGLFGMLGDVALFYVFAELGIGFMFALTRQRTKSQKVLRIASIVTVVVLLALTFAQFGYGLQLQHMSLDALREYYSLDDFSYESYPWENEEQMRLAAMRLYAAWSIINLLLSIGIITLAGIVMHQYRSIQPSRSSAEIFIAAAVLNMPRFLFLTIYYVSFLASAQLSSIFITSYAFYACDIVFSDIMRFISFVLVWVIGVRTIKGIWTTLQPWMNGATPTAGQVLYPVQVAPQMAYTQDGYPQAGLVYQQPATYGWAQYPQYPQYPAQLDTPASPNETAGQPVYMMGSPVPPPKTLQQDQKA